MKGYLRVDAELCQKKVRGLKTSDKQFLLALSLMKMWANSCLVSSFSACHMRVWRLSSFFVPELVSRTLGSSEARSFVFWHSSDRRLSVAPLAGMDRQGRGSLDSGSLAVGIPFFPSVSLPPYSGNPSLIRLTAPVPSGANP